MLDLVGELPEAIDASTILLVGNDEATSSEMVSSEFW
jgi:hypothetical protein